MKKIKMIISLILTMIITLAMAIPTMAADGGKSIRINPSSTVEITKSSEFRAYKILEATELTTENIGTQVNYKIPSGMGSFYREEFPSLASDSSDYGYQVAKAIQSKYKTNEEEMFAFSKRALAAAKNNTSGVAGAYKVDQSAAKHYYLIDGLDAGYYVVENTTAGSEDNSEKAVSAVITLDTTARIEAVTLKADKPKLEKKIDGKSDTDPETNNYVDFNNVSIGDDVPYVLTSRVPDMAGYTRYKYVVTDVLSKGLSFNKDSVEITIGETKLDSSAYDVNADENEETGKTTVKIVLKDFYENYKDRADETITISYSAKVNGDAVIGTAGNPNGASLAYSNDPNQETKGDSDDFEDGDPKGETPKDITYTYVTGIRLKKVDEDGNGLSGAQFKIEGERLNQILVAGYKFTETSDEMQPTADNEYYWGLDDGTYTKSNPENNGNTGKYKKTGDQYTIFKKEAYAEKELATATGETTKVSSDAEVDENGVLTFEGLGAGTYTITELVSPEGKQLLDEETETYTVKIDWIEPESPATACKWTATVTKGEETEKLQAGGDGIFEFQIVNTPGSKLPGTGGMGTTIFYVIGGILVVGAGILLVARRRKDN